MEVAVHGGPLAALERPWGMLVDDAHPGAAFRSYAWISSWWQAFGGALEPMVLVARREGSVVGILPLYLAPLPLGGTQLRLMGDTRVGSDYLGIVGSALDAPALAAAFARHLRGTTSELAFAELAEDDPLIPALASSSPEMTFRYPCPAVQVRGGFAEYLDGLPNGAGKQFLRRRRWLEKQPGHRFEVLRTREELARGMEVLFDLHRRRWALEGGSDGITPELEEFHRQAAGRLADDGKAAMFVLHVDGAPRAALYGFRTGDRFSYYQAGHDPDWRQRSVGTVVLGRAIERCFEDGLSEFDFLHGNEEYKLVWANGGRRTVTLRVKGRGLRAWLRQTGEAMDRSARLLAKRVLPGTVVAEIRRRRRAMSG